MAARKAKPGPWTQDGGSIYATHPTDEVVDWVYDESWEHIALNDPARVLRLVAAHRQILELHQPEPGQHPDFCGHDRHQMPCPTLLALAEAYAGNGFTPLGWLERVQPEARVPG